MSSLTIRFKVPVAGAERVMLVGQDEIDEVEINTSAQMISYPSRSRKDVITVPFSNIVSFYHDPSDDDFEYDYDEHGLYTLF